MSVLESPNGKLFFSQSHVSKEIDNSNIHSAIREINSSLLISNPLFVKYQTIEIQENVFVFKMDRFSMDLRQYLEETPFEERRKIVAVFARFLIDCVKFLASRGLSHRDIRPENICLVKDPLRFILIDYGFLSSTNAKIRNLSIYYPPIFWGKDVVSGNPDYWSVVILLMEFTAEDSSIFCVEDPYARYCEVMFDGDGIDFENPNCDISSLSKDDMKIIREWGSFDSYKIEEPIQSFDITISLPARRRVCNFKSLKRVIDNFDWENPSKYLVLCYDIMSRLDESYHTYFNFYTCVCLVSAFILDDKIPEKEHQEDVFERMKDILKLLPLLSDLRCLRDCEQMSIAKDEKSLQTYFNL